MIEKDTIKLLRECDAGVKMGVASIEDVVQHSVSEGLKKALATCKAEHKRLEIEIEELLEKFGDNGKKPDPMAKGMSKIKTEVKLATSDTDHTVADLMTDGCNMGVKSLSRYLNQYKAADEVSKDICKRLIKLEEQLAVDLRRYL